jgi:hypothetical protein
MNKPILTIGRAERVSFPRLGLLNIPARVDTGAKTSSVWASNIRVKNGLVEFYLFDESSKHYSGQKIVLKSFEQRVIASSNGALDKRYVVKLLVELYGRKIRASFTLANRASQTYPVLVGRNILRGKFIVDVKQGQPVLSAERLRSQQLQGNL